MRFNGDARFFEGGAVKGVGGEEIGLSARRADDGDFFGAPRRIAAHDGDTRALSGECKRHPAAQLARPAHDDRRFATQIEKVHLL